MEENEVTDFVDKFFTEHGYKTTREVYVHGYHVDLVAKKNDQKYFVECKGNRYLRSHEIHVMVGQIVSKMHEVGSNIHYCLAMPYSLATYLKEFSFEGIKALNLNLLVVGESLMWKGEVFYKDTEDIAGLIQALKKDSELAWTNLFAPQRKDI